MRLQTFNLRAPNSGWFLGTVQLLSNTEPSETANRLRRYINKRMHKDMSVHPVLNRC